MATKKTTTKAKTKTVAAKTSKKTTTKNVTKPAAAKKPASKSKVVSKPAVVTKPRATTSPFNRLRQLHLLSGLVFAVFAVLAAAFMASQAYSLTVSLMTKDTLLSNTQTVFAPAVKHIYDVELRWVLVGLLGISAVFSLLHATRLRAAYETKLAGRVVAYRWVDLMISAALISETLALLSGSTDVIALKLIGMTGALTAVFGWLAERENRMGAKTVWGSFTLSVVTKIVLVLMLGMNLLNTTIHGQVRLSWFVYALFGGFVVALVLYTLNHYRQLKGQDYIVTERNYLLLNLIGKAVFAGLLVIGLAR